LKDAVELIHKALEEWRDRKDGAQKEADQIKAPMRAAKVMKRLASMDQCSNYDLMSIFCHDKLELDLVQAQVALPTLCGVPLKVFIGPAAEDTIRAMRRDCQVDPANVQYLYEVDYGGKTETVWISHRTFVAMAKYHIPHVAVQQLQQLQQKPLELTWQAPLLLQDTSAIKEAIEEEYTSLGMLGVTQQRNSEGELVEVPLSTIKGRATARQKDLEILARTSEINKREMDPMHWVDLAKNDPSNHRFDLMKALALAHHFPIYDGPRPIDMFDYNKGREKDVMRGL